MAEFVTKIGERIKEFREAKGLSQAALARALPGTVDGNQVSRWERGIHRPNDDTLEAIADVLSIKITDLLDDPPAAGRVTPDPFAADPTGLLARVTALEAKLDELLEIAKDHVAYTRNVVEGRSNQWALSETIERIDARQEAIIEGIAALLPSEEENLRAAAQAVADAAQLPAAGSPPTPSDAESSVTPAQAPARRRRARSRPA